MRDISFTWMLLTEAVVLLVTLMVLRACGYRLVKLDRGAVSGSTQEQGKTNCAFHRTEA